jgi:hypothetical protein
MSKTTSFTKPEGVYRSSTGVSLSHVSRFRGFQTYQLILSPLREMHLYAGKEPKKREGNPRKVTVGGAFQSSQMRSTWGASVHHTILHATLLPSLESQPLPRPLLPPTAKQPPGPLLYNTPTSLPPFSTTTTTIKNFALIP